MIPAIVADIGGVNLIAWTIALYQLGSIVAGAASGLLANRYGVRLPLVLGAAVYGLGCAVSALAPEMWIMLVGRQLQGLGGGALIAISFVALGLLFPPRLVPRAVAAVSLVWGTSAFLGPLVGGLFVEYANWRGGFWFFAMQAAMLGGWLLLQRRAEFDRRRAEAGGRFPLWRLGWLSLGVLAIAWAGIEIRPLATPVALGAGFLCLVVFLRLDGRRDRDRLLPRRPIGFGDRLAAGFTMILCATTATIAIGVYGPLLMTLLHGASALAAGYVVACSSIGWSVAAVAIAGLGERHDRRMILFGMSLAFVSVVGFVYSVAHGPIWLIAVFAFIEGAGFGACWSFVLRRITRLAGAAEQSRATAAMPTIQRFGYAVGAAWIGIVGNAVGLERMPTAAVAANAAPLIFAACLPFALLALVAAWRFVAAEPPARFPTNRSTD